MNRDYRLKVSLSKRVQFCCTHTSFVDGAGNPLSRQNTATARRVLELWYRLIIDVLLSVIGIERTLDVMCDMIHKQPSTVPISEWIKSIDGMSDDVIHGRRCKLATTNAVTAWVGRLFRSKILVEVPRKELFCMLKFPKRLTLVDVDDLKTTTESAFFENIARVSVLNSIPQFTMTEADWIKKWLKGYIPPSLEDCHHSAGSTADPDVKRHLWEKWAYLREDNRIMKFCLKRRIPVVKMEAGEFLSTKMIEFYKYAKYDPTQIGSTEDYIPSRVQFVPKSYKTYRSVAMESSTRMFYQNGVLRQLRKTIRKKLYRNINLENQQRSREIAQAASSDKKMATIDFSMASDSVSLGLFQKWFGETEFGKDALLLRAHTFEYEGIEYHNPIAFTMGSPLCFPVECLVFLAMAYATIEQQGGNPEEETVVVYGDDVILPSKYAEAYMRRAMSNGFIPNWDKSYWQSDVHFREACGMEAYNGEDITPVYIPRKFTGSLEDSYCSYVHLANAAYGRGYFGMRRRLLDWLTHDMIYVVTSTGRRRMKKKRIQSYVCYSDSLEVLINEDSTIVFDPNASDFMKSRVIKRNDAYASSFKRSENGSRHSERSLHSVSYELYMNSIIPVAFQDKKFATVMGKGLSTSARLDFLLSDKPREPEDPYAKRLELAKLLTDGYLVDTVTMPTRGLEHTITALAEVRRLVHTAS